MSLVTDFLIGGYVCNDCNVTIVDNTTYPIYIPPSIIGQQRDYYGIAIFGSNDGFNTSVNQDLTSPTPGLWNPSVTGGGIWYFKAYIVSKWIISATYVQYDICFYNGEFYYVNDAGGVSPSEAVPSVNTKWTSMTSGTASANYALFDAAEVVGHRIGHTFVSVSVNCADITVTRTDCYDYDLCNTTASTQYFSITDLAETIDTDVVVGSEATAVYDSGVLIGYSLPANTCVSITLPSSGVFLVNYGSASDNLLYQKVIFELCPYWDCYFTLINNVLCADFDPCCQDCDNTSKQQNQIFRLELNKMEGLMFTLQAKVSYDQLVYRNVIAVSEERSNLLTEIESIISKLDDIIVRCGLCNGAQSTEVSNPCTNCN